MTTTPHYWVCPQCQTPNAVGVTRCRACDAAPGDEAQGKEGGSPPPGQPRAGEAQPPRPRQARPGDGSGLWPAEPSGAASQPGQVTRCPRCGMTHLGPVRFCERCGLDLLLPGPAPSTVVTTSRATSFRRLLVLGILVTFFVVASGFALLEVSQSPGGADERSPSRAGLATYPSAAATSAPPSTDVSPVRHTPAASAPPGADVPPVTRTPAPVAMGSITGGLTIIASGAGTGLRPPWVLATADLDAPVEQESGDPGPAASPDASDDSGCVGAGAFKSYAPGRAITVLDEHGDVLAAGELQMGSITAGGPESGCRMPFTIVDVPQSASYTFDVGSGTLRYTRTQLEERGWNVELEIAAAG